MRGQPRVSGGDPEVIPRRFKRKNFFVTYEGRRTKDGWTDRRDSRNSVVDGQGVAYFLHQLIVGVLQLQGDVIFQNEALVEVCKMAQSVLQFGLSHA